ncbi:hypothetical protein C2U72_11270 [Prosthecomicrobium hirschii]|uniref:hypothetical protein n=1 Tax=Prosthecodimorpha hirschii TaxID=665126 RepID=UPI0011277151|nr:hypothetical protein [Prosthecomicrobium hirschii]TPQ50864.1 hypothetical protein C2U72_11270 [Prosthecomicrobium hirschii]
MPRYHVIEAGRVVNTVLADGPNSLPGVVLVPDDGTAEIGWGYDGEVFVLPPPLPGPVPAVVSDRQFFHALAISSLITEAEALAAVRTGDIPAALQVVIDAMPEGDRFHATMLLSGAVEFRRDHPLVEAVRLARGMTDAAVDDLFRLAGGL